jgi:RNA polymerase sigma-70 factor (ECF subfamily)
MNPSARRAADEAARGASATLRPPSTEFDERDRGASAALRPPSPKLEEQRRDDYADLVRAVARGSDAAMERLLMRAQDAAWRFSLLVCGGADEAEDAMQDALIKTYRYARRIREPKAFRTWLYRTVRNACWMRRRRRVDEPTRLMSLDELMPAHGGHHEHEPVDERRLPDEQAMNAHLRRRLRAALAKLPPQHRSIVFLREVEGLSTREVARVVGITEANVKTRLHRARLFLRRELEDL